ncbi:MAG: hypothetical protein VKJ64_07725 [Leptolyngbyaceae bacterium]|nr:hypothetical protein [Leptolyngbyaceae bacterium]
MGKRWGLWLLVMIIGWGIAVRSINLGSHAYWVDEVHTAVRVAGYTKEDITTAQFDNQVHTVAAYNRYQQLTEDRNLGDVLGALAQHPEHPPLYYLLVRWWLQGLQHLGFSQSVAAMRSLSVLFGILLIPAIAALGWELYRSDPQQPMVTTDIAVALVALSPLHILYAQESREYSLWSLVTVLSCWGLLRAIRCRTLTSWACYSVLLMVGWYSHLLFATVAIAQSLYVLGLARSSRCHKPDDPVDVPQMGTVLRAMAMAIALSVLPFLPWVGVLLRYFSQIQTVVDATQQQPSLGYLIDVWGRNLSRVLVNQDLAGANLLLLGIGLWSIFSLWRSRPWRVSGLMVVLIGTNALPLMIHDILTGSIGSTRIRYLIPAYLGLQWAIAYFLATLIQWKSSPLRQSSQPLKSTWIRLAGQVLLVGLLMGGAIAGTSNLTQITNWAKSDKSAYYPAMAAAINQSPNPLVITDTSATYALVLTAQLRPDINLLLVSQPRALELPNLINSKPISDVFLFDPSAPLQRHLSRRFTAEWEAVVQQNERFQLLRLSLPYQEVGEN